VVFLAAVAILYNYSGCCIAIRLPIRSDGYGYYAYLTSVFIDGNLNMKTAMADRWAVGGVPAVERAWNGIALYAPTGRLLDKYTMGTAVLQVPFFLVCSAVARAMGDPPYSFPYQIGSVVSALFFLGTGTYLLLQTLLARFSARTSILTAASLIFGTSLFNNATFICSFSHVYSFFLLSLLVYMTQTYVGEGQANESSFIPMSTLLGTVVGLIALTRIPNVVAALIPVAATFERFRRARQVQMLVIEILCSVLGFVFVFSLQMTYWWMVTGHLLLNSYQEEQFDWLHPHLVEFLFGARRGMFFWSPLLLIAVVGIPRSIRLHRAIGLAIIVVLTLEIYLCASWWSWWFGMSFESRPVSDMAPLLAFPLASGLEILSEKLGRWVVAATVSVLLAVNCFLMLSYWNGYFPRDNPSITDLVRLPRVWVFRLTR